MNYKTILLTSAAIMFASAATAEDFTGSLYLPSQGKVLSDTSLMYNRTSLKRDAGTLEDLRLQQEMTYGVTDNFSVVGMIGNQFDFNGWTNGDYNNDHNFDYGIGAMHNMREGKLVGQVGVGYYTFNPKSWQGHRKTNSRWYKELNANVQVGYELCEGLTPYTSFTAIGNIDDSDRDLTYSWFAGAHKSWDRYALDAGVRYDFRTDGPNKNSWYLQAEANYFVTNDVALGVFGDYYIGGNSYSHYGMVGEIDYEYSIGLNAKVLF